MNQQNQIDLVHTVFLDEPNDHSHSSFFVSNLYKDISQIKYELYHPQRKDDQLIQCNVYFHPDTPIQSDQSSNTTKPGDYFMFKFSRNSIQSEMIQEQPAKLKITHYRLKKKQKNGKTKCKIEAKQVNYQTTVLKRYCVVSAIKSLVIGQVKGDLLENVLYKQKTWSQFKHPRQLFQYINEQKLENQNIEQIQKLDKTETKASQSELTNENAMKN